MHQQIELYLYKFRFAVGGTAVIALLVVFSALVSMVGAHTVIDPRSHHTITAVDTSVYDSANQLTAGFDNLAVSSEQAALSAGKAFYGGCRSVTTTTASTGRAIAHGSASAIGGIWHGTTFLARGIASVTMFSLRTSFSVITYPYRVPGKVASALSSTQSVSSIIRPADEKTVPVISGGLSEELQTRISEQAQADAQAASQQQLQALEAAQLAANKGLDGTIVAGDPAHGGYPANWDNARQDSMLDNWGMYNRECVSYAAWKVYQTYGSMPYWGGVGNANQWLRNARAAGIATSSAPRAHSVAISLRGYYGHAMWVEKVQGDMIYVSQYNYDLHGHYSEMWVNASYFTYIYFK